MIETVVQAHQSPFAVGLLTYICLLGIIVAGSLGQFLQQSAFSSGSPEVVVAGLTVIDPIIGATVGLAVLGEAARGAALGVLRLRLSLPGRRIRRHPAISKAARRLTGSRRLQTRRPACDLSTVHAQRPQ